MSVSDNPPRRRPLVPAVPGPKMVSPGLVAGQGASPNIAAGNMARAGGGGLPSMAVPLQVGNIAAAVASVMANIGTIEKRGINKFHGYKYALMEDVLEALTPQIGKAGLCIIQNEVEIKLEGSRLAVTYEFSIIHKSNEIWPERPRFTGVALARDSKGNLDDKAINKAHSTARKYFLLALFQVPAGDFPEADADSPNANQRQEPVPGPTTTRRAPEQKPAPPPAEPPGTQQMTPEGKMNYEARVKASEKMLEEGTPHRIVLTQGAGADQWAGRYIKAIEKAKTREEIVDWEKENDGPLQHISNDYAGVYEMILAAVERRLATLNPPDNTERMNEIAGALAGFTVYEEAETWWNANVAPHENEYDPVEWDMLLQEWKRTEDRLREDQNNPDQAAE